MVVCGLWQSQKGRGSDREIVEGKSRSDEMCGLKWVMVNIMCPLTGPSGAQIYGQT